jgi:hypothetical protein
VLESPEVTSINNVDLLDEAYRLVAALAVIDRLDQ